MLPHCQKSSKAPICRLGGDIPTKGVKIVAEVEVVGRGGGMEEGPRRRRGEGSPEH